VFGGEEVRGERPPSLAPIKHRGVEAQAALSVLRSRHSLVAARTALVNHVRGVVKAVGERLPRCSVESFPRKVLRHVPEELRSAAGPVLSQIADLTVRIRAYDRAIEVLARERFPEAGLLQQVVGVGALTALAFVLTLEDPARFSRSRTVGSYLGLRPRQRESGTPESRTAALNRSATSNRASGYRVGEGAALSGSLDTGAARGRSLAEVPSRP
jgi:transposase